MAILLIGIAILTIGFYSAGWKQFGFVGIVILLSFIIYLAFKVQADKGSWIN